MKRILLVDDEPPARQHIRTLIPWADFGCEIAGEAGNGEEALRLCAALKPDIAFVDITMPVMDGIELLQRMHADYPQVRCIVLTAHRDFAYAEQAIQHRAFGYVLKAPIHIAEMQAAIEKACRDLDRDSGYAQNEKQHAQVIRSYQYPLNKKMLHDLRTGVLSAKEEIVREGGKLGLDLASPDYGLLLCSADKFAAYAGMYPDGDKELIEFSVLEIVRETLAVQQIGSFELLPEGFGRFALLLTGLDAEFPAESYPALAKRIYESLAAPLKNYVRLDLAMTYSRPFRSMTEFRRMYAETSKSAGIRFFQERPAPVAARETLPYQALPEAEWEDCRRRLGEWLQSGEADPSEWTKRARNALLKHQPEPAAARRLFRELKPLVDNCLPAWPEEDGSAPAWPDFAEAASLRESLDALSDCILAQARRLPHIRELRLEIGEALQFIKRNLQVELTLESIANAVQLSPSYFGHLFKKELQLSVVDYIAEQRMEAAKALLLEGKYRNYELAEKVGYQNYSYFCTIFKSKPA